MSRRINPNKIVIFTGAGISAESGIMTFRDKDGHWAKMDPMKVVSTEAWDSNPQALIDFHNARLATIEKAQPNAAHLALRDLEEKYEVIVVTQNVDDLHERAGSSKILHLHGIVTEVFPDGCRERAVYRGYEPLSLEERDPYGRPFRPNTVLFGEQILHCEEAIEAIADAGKILVVGTSLAVYPAAGLLNKASFHAEKIIVSHEVESVPYGYEFIRGDATVQVPFLVRKWLSEAKR
ncbi:NAD-dependent protein deacylase Sir2 [Rubritalea halochordaticola]|uniref:protein acetyllysine N-acetyltransferase n=1 Tax=Rubritalea halochordaticola TaxID=714537 RepID=A0ABP9V082_9BACT